jgi:hypothetical protein
MAVSRCTITDIEYWKVYRRWGDTTIQRYFPVNKPNERKSHKKALEQDESLRQRQRAYLSRQVFDLNHHIMPDGKLRGVRRVTVNRAGRKPAEFFQIRIKLPWDEAPQFTSLSIEKHGVDEAFDLAVQWYCDAYGFDRRSEMRSALRECLSAYKTTLVLKTLPSSVTESATSEDWVTQMEKEIEHFKARDKRAIKG